MKPEDFALILKNKVVETFVYYENTLKRIDNATDETWNEFLPIYKSLTEEQKISILNFLKMVQINSISSVLSLLDGISYVNEDRDTFELKTKKGELLNGDLQDIFLEMIKNEENI